MIFAWTRALQLAEKSRVFASLVAVINYLVLALRGANVARQRAERELVTVRHELAGAVTGRAHQKACAQEAAAEAAALHRAFYHAIVAGLREGSPDDALAPFTAPGDSHGLRLLKELGSHRAHANDQAAAARAATGEAAALRRGIAGVIAMLRAPREDQAAEAALPGLLDTALAALLEVEESAGADVLAELAATTARADEWETKFCALWDSVCDVLDAGLHEEPVVAAARVRAELVALLAADDEHGTITVQRDRARASEEALRRGVEELAARFDEDQLGDQGDQLRNLLDSVDAQGTLLMLELDEAHERTKDAELALVDTLARLEGAAPAPTGHCAYCGATSEHDCHIGLAGVKSAPLCHACAYDYTITAEMIATRVIAREAPPVVARIPVVAAVIVRGGRLLLAQRHAEREHGGKWECPGGKIERWETGTIALSRELREELGVEASVGSLFGAIPLDPPAVAVPLTLSFLCVDIGEHEPRPLDAVAIRWCSRAEVLALDMTPGNDAIRAELAALCAPATPLTGSLVTSTRPEDDIYLSTSSLTDRRHITRMRLTVDAVREAGAEVARVEDEPECGACAEVKHTGGRWNSHTCGIHEDVTIEAHSIDRPADATACPLDLCDGSGRIETRERSYESGGEPAESEPCLCKTERPPAPDAATAAEDFTAANLEGESDEDLPSAPPAMALPTFANGATSVPVVSMRFLPDPPLPGDKVLHCDECGSVPHRLRPSPEAGPWWRCSECGGATASEERASDSATLAALDRKAHALATTTQGAAS